MRLNPTKPAELYNTVNQIEHPESLSLRLRSTSN